MTQAVRLNLRMQKEIKLLMADPPPGVSFPFLSDNDNSFPSLSSIEARLRGPEGSVYCEGLFTLKIQIPERYPFQPPNVTFVTPIYHPNIDNGGRICLDILNLPPKGAWQPSLNISTVMMSIGLLLSDPNPDDGLMAEASREYKYNRNVFYEKARDWTQRFANILTAAKVIDDIILPNLKMSELSTPEILSEEPVHETEGNRKKLRLMGGKLSLTSVAPFKRVHSENIENTLNCSVKIDEEITSPQKLLPPCADQLKQQINEDQKMVMEEKCKGFNETPVDIRMIIVSDSEESDHESDRSYRSRPSLLQKRSMR